VLGYYPFGTNADLASERCHMGKMLIIRADWDAEAGVWIATSPDISGLVAEGDDLDALRARAMVMASELLELNHAEIVRAESVVQFIASRKERLLPA
jgi:predicted RNase H-like HicB family nuclease